jgi:hypothetical protein
VEVTWGLWLKPEDLTFESFGDVDVYDEVDAATAILTEAELSIIRAKRERRKIPIDPIPPRPVFAHDPSPSSSTALFHPLSRTQELEDAVKHALSNADAASQALTRCRM